jgi:hypothetical protein
MIIVFNLFSSVCCATEKIMKKKIHANQKCEFVLQVLIIMANSAVFMWPRNLECCKIIFKSGQKNQIYYFITDCAFTKKKTFFYMAYTVFSQAVYYQF